jgi:c-di-GMP-binding flagellar brake protein YcgR
MQFTPIKQDELTVGQAIPWPLCDPSGKVLLEQGSKPESAAQIQSLIESGAGRYQDSQPEQPNRTESAKQAQHESGGFSLDHIKPKIGDSMQLQLQSGTDNHRSFVTLIGYLADQSVIVTMPVIHGHIMLIREGQSFIVRFFSGKNAYAFSATAKKVTSIPYPYLHLSYPLEVRGLVVRSSSRAHAHINCHVSIEDGDSYKCVARDISIGGALIAIREQFGKVGETLLLKLPVQINETEHMLNLNCQIRSNNAAPVTANEAPTYLLGLSFENMTGQDTLVISALLYQSLVSDKDIFD